ncbi:MAG: butyrate kinase [Terracidiphilus sp.]
MLRARFCANRGAEDDIRVVTEQRKLVLVFGATMRDESSRVLAINPGSTSTKFGVFTRSGAAWVGAIHHRDSELEQFRGRSALDQLEYRAAPMREALQQAGYSADGFAAVAGRGGLLPPMECGTYLVDDAIVKALREARRGEHACNLGAVLALKFARVAGVDAYIVDPVTVDEWQDCARLSGLPLIPRSCIGHALNTKAVARRYAREQGRTYASLRLVVVHMGSGITVSAHREGRMIDNNTPEEGPFGPDRTGSLPVQALIRLCCSGAYNAKQLDRMVFGEGGLFAYLGTRDLREVEGRIDAGDAAAALAYDAMVYQIAKETGAMATVLQGAVDAVLLTGGMAHSERLVQKLRGYIEWIAPIAVYPGEDELQALAEGVFRVLDGEETAKRLGPESSGVSTGAERERLVIGLE